MPTRRSMRRLNFQGLGELPLGHVKPALPVILVALVIQGDRLALQVLPGLPGRGAAQPQQAQHQ